jgi:phospholipase C
VVGCELPPTAANYDVPIDTGPRASNQAAVLAAGAERAACTFAAGAKPADTLAIDADDLAAIPIRHVIVLMKENRSFDQLLGELGAAGQPDAESIPDWFVNQDTSGATVSPFELATTCLKWDPGHQWDAAHAQVNGGAMDGFVTSAASTTPTDGHFVMGHYQQTDLPFYYWLANTFAINDHHFASVRGGTWPNRDFLLLGTADGVRCTSCGRPNPGTPTIFDALDAAGETWGAFADGDPFDGALGWSAPHAGLHPFQDFLNELGDGTLPSVAFVDGVPGVQDEHPAGDLQQGEAWTRKIYLAAVASPLWPQLAIIWTYDEAGGFADHVPPPSSACVARPDNPLDMPFVELGVRVPLVVISPYAKPHYVSHVVHDHTAITRFIEVLFNLPALTARDANSDALLDMFDFSRVPAPLTAEPGPASGTGGCQR